MTKGDSAADGVSSAPKPVFGGYSGKILRINLSKNKVAVEPISEQFCRKYLGGAGFIAYFLWKELKPGTDALGSDNKLIFALGPISGMVLPGASRCCIGAKSPLAGGIAKSEVGGLWMTELKRAGYDAVIIEGKAVKPAYIWIHDGEASIRDAGHLWGKETKETQEIIRSELGDDHVQVAMIGKGGENTVRFACIMVGCHDAAGRGGLGAVMGSKNLKAVAVRGTGRPLIVDEERVKEIRKTFQPFITSEFGTGGPDMMAGEASGDLPIRNFRDGTFPQVKQIHGGVIKDTYRIDMEGCYACPVRCKKVVKIDKPYTVDPAYGGPEYETLASLGSNCGIGDLEAICKANERCNAYSLDTISIGGVIAFAMECFEKGLLTVQDTSGLELKWGNAEGMLKAIEFIARREGIGNLLAEGTARASRRIGGDCRSFAMHVKGLEPGMHEPRIASGLAIAFMVCPIGADHCACVPDVFLENEVMFEPFHKLGWTDTFGSTDLSPAKMAVLRVGQFQHILNDAMVVCMFMNISLSQMAELLGAITGWDTGITELLRIAERILTLMRLFNVREGLTAEDDTLPKRFFQSTIGGALKDYKPDPVALEKAKKYFYMLMGWDARGVPLPEKVEELYID